MLSNVGKFTFNKVKTNFFRSFATQIVESIGEATNNGKILLSEDLFDIRTRSLQSFAPKFIKIQEIEKQECVNKITYFSELFKDVEIRKILESLESPREEEEFTILSEINLPKSSQMVKGSLKKSLTKLGQIVETSPSLKSSKKLVYEETFKKKGHVFFDNEQWKRYLSTSDIPVDPEANFTDIIPCFEALGISGASVKGLVYGGALMSLHDEGILERIKKFYCVSAGSISGVIIASAMSPQNRLGRDLNSELLLKIITNLDFGDLMDIKGLTPEAMKKIEGLYDKTVKTHGIPLPGTAFDIFGKLKNIISSTVSGVDNYLSGSGGISKGEVLKFFIVRTLMEFLSLDKEIVENLTVKDFSDFTGKEFYVGTTENVVTPTMDSEGESYGVVSREKHVFGPNSEVNLIEAVLASSAIAPVFGMRRIRIPEEGRWGDFYDGGYTGNNPGDYGDFDFGMGKRYLDLRALELRAQSVTQKIGRTFGNTIKESLEIFDTKREPDARSVVLLSGDVGTFDFKPIANSKVQDLNIGSYTYTGEYIRRLKEVMVETGTNIPSIYFPIGEDSGVKPPVRALKPPNSQDFFNILDELDKTHRWPTVAEFLKTGKVGSNKKIIRHFLERLKLFNEIGENVDVSSDFSLRFFREETPTVTFEDVNEFDWNELHY